MFLFAEEEGAQHVPWIVQKVNHYFGEPVYHFQLAYTKPLWDKFFANFGTTPESVFGAPYSPVVHDHVCDCLYFKSYRYLPFQTKAFGGGSEQQPIDLRGELPIPQ